MAYEQLQRDVTSFVSEHFGDRDITEQDALAELMLAFGRDGYLPAPSVAAALDTYLAVRALPELAQQPAREFVDNFFTTHPNAARMMFFKRASNELDPETAGTIDRIFSGELMLDLWPTDWAGPAAAPPTPATPEKTFTESDFSLFIHRHFGRDRMFTVDAPSLRQAIAEATGELDRLLADANCPPEAMSDYHKRLEEGFLSVLRDALEQAESGADGPTFHFMP